MKGREGERKGGKLLILHKENDRVSNFQPPRMERKKASRISQALSVLFEPANFFSFAFLCLELALLLLVPHRSGSVWFDFVRF